MCESPAHQKRQEDHSLRPQRRLPQLHRGELQRRVCFVAQRAALVQFNYCVDFKNEFELNVNKCL